MLRHDLAIAPLIEIEAGLLGIDDIYIKLQPMLLDHHFGRNLANSLLEAWYTLLLGQIAITRHIDPLRLEDLQQKVQDIGLEAHHPSGLEMNTQILLVSIHHQTWQKIPLRMDDTAGVGIELHSPGGSSEDSRFQEPSAYRLIFVRQSSKSDGAVRIDVPFGQKAIFFVSRFYQLTWLEIQIAEDVAFVDPWEKFS